MAWLKICANDCSQANVIYNKAVLLIVLIIGIILFEAIVHYNWIVSYESDKHDWETMVWAAGASPSLMHSLLDGSKANDVTQLFLNTLFTI